MPKNLKIFLNEKDWQDNEKEIAHARRCIKSPAL
jgi:hypothetical protein